MTNNDETRTPSGGGSDNVGTQGAAEVTWDDSKMTTNFANVVNVQSTREQVDLFFGTNQTWNTSSEQDFKVELTNRLILTPYAAKRLWLVLGGVLQEYEGRYGDLTIEGTRAQPADAAE